MKKYINNKSVLIIALAIVGIFVITSSIITAVDSKDTTNKSISNRYKNGNRNSLKSSHQIASANINKANTGQNDMLIYLIEEEKLAHDVYAAMYQKYGSNVFNNISKSETNHQSKVLSLLIARQIKDPSLGDVGSFKNPDLQQLYDKLIEQGSQSVYEAYKVGVAIEELDISDIDKQLESATDSDIIMTLNSLKRTSQSHLRAFNIQLQ